MLFYACCVVANGEATAAAWADTVIPPRATISPELRLGAIGYRLATANAGRCLKPQMLTGLMLHELGAYPARYRQAVTADLGLTYGFGIRAIIPESAGTRSGLYDRDEIIAVNGRDLRSFGTELASSQASYNRTERFYDLLDAELRKGPANLTIRRASETLTIELRGDPGCGGRMALMDERALNAWSDGRYVGLTTRMMEFVPDDSELAFVVAHEMSHNMLGHDRTKGVGNPLVQFGIGAEEMKATELEADIFAVHLMAAAGYDPYGSERFLRRMRQAKPLSLAITHPRASRRIAAVRTEIERMQSKGLSP